MPVRATTRGVTIAALMAALGRPSWWVLALAGFLVRGGILLFVLAVVTIPSPLALSNVLAPLLTPLYFGRLEPSTAALIGTLIVAVVSWLVAGSWFAAATEVVLVRDARTTAADDGLPATPPVPAGRLVITRAAAAHLLALFPLALAVGAGSVAILDVTYRELVNPSDTGPIVLRVIGGSAGAVAVIATAWILGEIVGGLAVRRVVLLGDPIVRAVAAASVDLVRRPVGSLVAPLVTTVVLGLDLLAVLLVVALVWLDVRERLNEPTTDPVAMGLTLATFGGAWCLALMVTGLIGAWRSAAMSYEVQRAALASPARTQSVADGVAA